MPSSNSGQDLRRLTGYSSVYKFVSSRRKLKGIAVEKYVNESKPNSKHY